MKRFYNLAFFDLYLFNFISIYLNLNINVFFLMFGFCLWYIIDNLLLFILKMAQLNFLFFNYISITFITLFFLIIYCLFIFYIIVSLFCRLIIKDMWYDDLILFINNFNNNLFMTW